MSDVLKSLWADLLGRNTDEIEDDLNFFEAGGDSVAALKLADRASKQHLALSAQKIFQHPTLGEQIQLSEQHEDNEGRANGTPTQTSTFSTFEAFRLVNNCLAQCGLDAARLEDVLPCTPFQKELIQASHELGCWTFQAVFEISNNAEARARLVIEDLHQRNPVFRTRIAQHETDLYQLVFKGSVEWDVVDGPLEVYKSRDLTRRMTYGSRLSRCAIVNDHGRDAKFVVWTQTHALYDRWSKMHVLDDLRSSFIDHETFKTESSRLSFKQFADFVQHQDAQKSIDHWKKQLEGLQRCDLLSHTPPSQRFKTSEDKTLRVTTKYQKPTNTNITFATVAHTAWALVLAKESKASDVFFCSFRSCRQMDMSSIDSVIGPLWSMVPVRMQLTSGQSLQDLLQAAHQCMVEGIPHEPYGVTALDEHFGHKGYLQSVLLPQPPQPDTFAMEIEHKDKQKGETMTFRSAEEHWTQTRGHFGLYIMLTPKKDDLELWGRIDESFIDEARVERLLNAYAAMLEKLFELDWKETKISSVCPDMPEEEDSTDDANNEDYTLKGIDHEVPKTLTHLPNQSAKQNTVCIVPSGEKALDFTYEDLETHIRALQKALAELGIKYESAVSISLGNTYELVVAFLATTRQRAIAAPLHPGYKQDEFEFYVDDMSSSLVLIAKGKFKDDEPAVAAARKHEAAIAEVYWDADKQQVVLDVKEEGKLKEINDQEVLEAQEDDVALVLHTSGTTGRPKAVPLTHLNLITNIDNICTTYRLQPHDRTMLIMPLFHVHGLLASFLSPLRSGGCAIIPARLTPEFWSQFKDNKATWYSATPTMHRMILQFPLPDSGLPKFRFIRSCSSQLAPTLFEQLEKKFECPVLESYAMTEASHMMFSNPLPPGKHYPGSVGLPQYLDVKLLDEQGTEVEKGKEGEVSIRGKNVTKGYINNEEANKSSFIKEGFFRTGDQGKFDDNGYLVLTGRLKELINKGGEKISSVELDNVIRKHDDIAECVSFAVDDEDYGQEVGAAIKLKDSCDKLDVKALTKWIGEKLSAQKVPKKVCCHKLSRDTFTDLPRSGSRTKFRRQPQARFSVRWLRNKCRSKSQLHEQRLLSCRRGMNIAVSLSQKAWHIITPPHTLSPHPLQAQCLDPSLHRVALPPCHQTALRLLPEEHLQSLGIGSRRQ